MTWGLPWRPQQLGRRGDEAVGGPGARLGQCLGLAYFRGARAGADSAAPAALLLARVERVYVDVMLAWWWPDYLGPGTAEHDGRQLPAWAGYLERTLIQKSFAWGLASWMVDAGQAGAIAALRSAFEEARGSCEPQAVTLRAEPRARLPSLRVAYLPYDGTVPPPAETRRWCLNVACANASWVRHCFGSFSEKMACTQDDYDDAADGGDQQSGEVIGLAAGATEGQGGTAALAAESATVPSAAEQMAGGGEGSGEAEGREAGADGTPEEERAAAPQTQAKTLVEQKDKKKGKG